ncbi:MAG: efflux RND transporter periplasmic adaptor subunit [Chloroflexi bacterium]|nr:efflux RND transporter periplasmic adaptor subunit [Chloroflexota bacterium]
MSRRNLIIIAVVLVVVVLGYMAYAQGRASKPEAQPMAQEEPTLTPVVSVSGVVVPRTWATLSFSVGGRLVELPAREGASVAPGDVLARLDDIALRAAVESAAAAVDAARATLAKTTAGARPEEIAVAEANLAAAQAALEKALHSPRPEEVAVAQAQVDQAATELAYAQSKYDRYAHLGGEEELRHARDAAGAAHSLAVAQLNLLKAGAPAEDIAAARAQVKAAQAQFDLLRAGASEADIALAKAQLAQAEASLAAAQATLDQAVLRAPFAGTVGRVHVRLGEMISPGVPVVTLGDLSDLVVEITDLNEMDVWRVKVGQRADLTFDGLPGRVLRGHVERIAPMATPGAGGTNFPTIIVLDETDPGLRWGMTAFADIYVQ